MKTAHLRRRGVLLLVVLSMLTLFMMLGVTYLVVSTRARKTARAFANNAVSTTASGINSQRLLDEAMMAVARGTTGTSAIPSLQNGNDLLGDKYGQGAPVTGTILGNATGSAIIAIPTATLPNAHLLAGRVITFTMPTLNDVSTRILRVYSSGNGCTVYIPGGQTVAGAAITAANINAAKQAASSGPHFIVNGREFDGNGNTNEPYDAVIASGSASDPCLAQVALISGTTVVTPSFGISAASATIDNDGDGVTDSGWIDVGFPQITDLTGNVITPKAAILVIDLDGRLNLNVHGARTDLENTADANDCTSSGLLSSGSSSNFYPNLVFTTTSSTATIPMQALPRGVGTGVAEISLFGPVVGNAKSTGLAEMLGGSTLITSQNQLADKITGRPRPNLGDTQGRYGDTVFNPTTPTPLAAAKPGDPDVDDNAATDRWVSASGTSYFENTSTRYGSPSDLKGRMRVWTDSFGQPVYYKPYWSQSGAGNRGLFADDDVVDDPHELNAGRAGPRTGAVRSGTATPSDNLYTTADLEGVLRFFDPDSMRLPRRLLTICRDWAAAARPLITTESWDTPAVTGRGWNDALATPFATLLQSSNAQDFFSPETIMGHKMDLNRPFHDTDVTEPYDAAGIGLARRQQFAKHLYCLLVALFQINNTEDKNENGVLDPGEDLNNNSKIDSLPPSSIEAEQLAQWAVNIVDFRDADSIMTPFDYDESFQRGSQTWNATNTKRVWGAERPEILITETLAWHDRRTDDRSVGGTFADQTNPDNDFDQNVRPRGAFFVELYSPWGSQAKQYDASGVVDVTGTVTTLPKFRGEPLPAELASSSGSRFDRAAAVVLTKTHSGTANTTDSSTNTQPTTVTGSNFPIWRLVTVRGNVDGGTGFGKDPLATGTATGTTAILDPSRSGTTVKIDRVFYFTTPTQSLLNEKPGAVFWQSTSSTANPSQQNYVVVGTSKRLDFDYKTNLYLSSNDNPSIDIAFDQPRLKPATVSEPTCTESISKDPYDGLIPSGSRFTPDDNAAPHVYDRFLDNPQSADPGAGSSKSIDLPFDGMAPSLMPAGFSDVFYVAGSGTNSLPLLMRNGTHENFAVVHLQRLADPTQPWNATSNPYLTVDSMPVDLTVVNTAGSDGENSNVQKNQNYDEPNCPAKDYRYQSTERGGKKADNPKNESDIWNRRVQANKTNVDDPDAFRTAAINSATASPVTVTPGPPRKAIFSVRSVTFTGTSNTTFNAKPNRFSNTRFPWLFWPNRPFTNAAELALAPRPNCFRLPAQHTTGTGSGWNSGPFNHLCGLFESGTTPSEPWKSVIGSGSANAVGILDFVHVPSRFTGSYVTISASTANASTIGLDDFPINQISQFREPGRINVNTLAMSSMSGTSVNSGTSWNPLFGKIALPPLVTSASSTYTPPLLGLASTGTVTNASGTSTPTILPPFTPPLWNEISPRNPFTSSGTAGGVTSGSATPAGSLLAILNRIGVQPNANPSSPDNSYAVDNTSSWPQALRDARDHDKDSYFRYDMPIRMANMVTTRSNVYAIWVTIGYFDSSGNEIEPVRRNRAFYILDRSIPVGYERGKDHNVRDAILLRRIIQ